MFLYRSRDKGSAFIVALWALLVLGSLALAVNSYVWPQLNVAGKLRDRAKLHYLAEAALKRAIAEVSTDEIMAYDALKDPWSSNEAVFKDAPLGDSVYSVKYTVTNPETGEGNIRYGLIDEERKISINTASQAVLVSFFEIVGNTSSAEASGIAASIVDWRDTDDTPLENGAENGYYMSLELPYPCKNGNFQVPEELLLVKGVTRQIFDSVKDRITVSGFGAVNINTADGSVLRSLGISGGLVDKIIDFRKGNDDKEATEDDGIFDNVSTIANTLSESKSLSKEELAELSNLAASGALTVRSDNFMGRCYGGIRGQEKTASVTFIFNRGKAVKYWRED